MPGFVVGNVQPDCAHDLARLDDRELVGPESEFVVDESAGMVVGVGPRDGRDPALDLWVLTRRMDPRHVVLAPRPQDDQVVVKLHPCQLNLPRASMHSVVYSGAADATAYYDTVADIASTLVGAVIGACLVAVRS